MPAHKGHKKTGGRKKGTPNKLTASVKAALVEAFDELGGIPALVKWGKKNPTQFYTLWGKMLPTEVRAEHSGTLNQNHNLGNVPPELKHAIAEGVRLAGGSTPL